MCPVISPCLSIQVPPIPGPMSRTIYSDTVMVLASLELCHGMRLLHASQKEANSTEARGCQYRNRQLVSAYALPPCIEQFSLVGSIAYYHARGHSRCMQAPPSNLFLSCPKDTVRCSIEHRLSTRQVTGMTQRHVKRQPITCRTSDDLGHVVKDLSAPAGQALLAAGRYYLHPGPGPGG